MKRIFSQLLSLRRSNYVTTTTTTKNPPVTVNGGNSSKTRVKAQNQRTITISTGQGSLTPVGSNAVRAIPPQLSVDMSPLYNSSTYSYNYLQKPEQDLTLINLVEADHYCRKDFYASLLTEAIEQGILTGYKSQLERKSWLLSELSLKRVLSKNQEMKKVILKVAAMALAHNESGEINHRLQSLHPFIPTAGEVFFGVNYSNNEAIQDGQQIIQDILTPGLLILLLDKLIINNTTNQLEADISKRHLLLAKALVETVAGYLIHRTVQETNHMTENVNETSKHIETIHQGNKLATLTGDLLVVSLIKNVSCTGNNKVLELVMNSLSEFSTTEIARKEKPFQETYDNNSNIYTALMPKTLAESIVFSKGFQSSILLSGVYDKSVLEWADKLGNIMGLLWKTNFDYEKLSTEKKIVENILELNAYMEELREQANFLLNHNVICVNDQITDIFRQLINYWGLQKRNL